MNSKLKDQTGFGAFLESKGFSIKHPIKSGYFNTHNECVRVYEKGGKRIHIGLHSNPIRVGILYPEVRERQEHTDLRHNTTTVKHTIQTKYTYLPEPHEYDHYLEKLTTNG